MKYIAINGSFRKKGNSAQMMASAIEGIRSADPKADIKEINIYDIDFKGCRGCQGCHLKNKKRIGCIVKDGAYDLLNEIRDTDGFAFASPIYYFEISSELRSLFERLFYPGHQEQAVPVCAIYTMNQPEENMKKRFLKDIEHIDMFLSQTLNSDVEDVFSFQTLGWNNNKPFEFDDTWYEKRKSHALKQLPIDKQKAKEAGMRLVERIRI